MSSLVPAIDRAIQVLYLFKEGAQKEYGVSEISRLLDLNKSTAHNILNTLAHHNFLAQNETTRRYRLGPALADLGSLVRSRIDIRAVARPYMRRLVEQTGATILLGVFGGITITIIDKEEPLTDLRIAASVGMQIPFCAGSFGQAFLAYLPERMVDRLLVEPGLTQFTPTSMTDPEQYKAGLAAVREQGYAIDNDEAYLRDVGAISAPIFAPGVGSADGGSTGREAAAAITLVDFNSRLSQDKIEMFVLWVVGAARSISEEMGMPLNRHRFNSQSP